MVNCLGFNDPSIPVKTICNPCIKKLYTCQSKFYGIILYVYYEENEDNRGEYVDQVDLVFSTRIIINTCEDNQ